MDSRVLEIEQKLSRALKVVESSFIAQIISDNGDNVDVKDFNDTVYEGVRKIATAGTKGIIFRLKKDSFVIVSRISQADELFVSMYSQIEAASIDIESIVINGGSNGGLTITPELKSQLDTMSARIDQIVSCLKTGSNTSGNVVFTGIAAVESMPKESFNKIENKKIKQ